MTSVSQVVVVEELESDNEKPPKIELPLCWLVSLDAAVELVVAVSVWFVSVALVLSVVLSVSLEELEPVMLLPVRGTWPSWLRGRANWWWPCGSWSR